MSIKNLNEWNQEVNGKEEPSSACGSTCGTADTEKKEEPSSACGSACGAGDK